MKNKNHIKAVIYGCSGLSLTTAERDFFKRTNPLGLIIFDRNVQTPDQVSDLIRDFRETVGRSDAPVLVDQEGGRVTRLWPPYWHGLGWNNLYGVWYRQSSEKGIDGVRAHAKTLAEDLLSVGINVDCWPCLDVATPRTHDIMIRRCFSDDMQIVSILGKTAVETALKNGLMPVIKHIPGYGRTRVDPHQGLPVVDERLEVLGQTDFYPFRQVNLPVWGMTAHVIYCALDAQLPATLSETVLQYIRNQIGFEGFLISDDISMGALQAFGRIGELAHKMIAAGCDCVLHCNGRMEEMSEIAQAVPDLTQAALQRLKTAEDLKHG
ncbi:MAG: glycoside hydrolase family 3 N-terminal domain-containing protein [Alphaproteobacteria bacterium]